MTTFDIKAYSRRGVDRKRNEDACAVGEQFLYGQHTGIIKTTISNIHLPFLICVADGLGGHKDGDVASRMAVKHISYSFCNLKNKFDVTKIIDSAHTIIQSNNNESKDTLAMGTTIVGAILKTKQCTIFNVGDSRAYLINDQIITQVSVDHVSWGMYGPSIAQCLGGGFSLSPIPYVKTYDIVPGNQIILVSDGVTDTVSDEKIMEIILDGEPLKAQRLCEEASQNGGGDDASIIIVYIR